MITRAPGRPLRQSRLRRSRLRRSRLRRSRLRRSRLRRPLRSWRPTGLPRRRRPSRLRPDRPRQRLRRHRSGHRLHPLVAKARKCPSRAVRPSPARRRPGLPVPSGNRRRPGSRPPAGAFRRGIRHSMTQKASCRPGHRGRLRRRGPPRPVAIARISRLDRVAPIARRSPSHIRMSRRTAPPIRACPRPRRRPIQSPPRRPIRTSPRL
jgi:hypothetical protein